MAASLKVYVCLVSIFIEALHYYRVLIHINALFTSTMLKMLKSPQCKQTLCLHCSVCNLYAPMNKNQVLSEHEQNRCGEGTLQYL